MLTKEHLALHAAERARIERAGGHVSDGRLNGRMQVRTCSLCTRMLRMQVRTRSLCASMFACVWARQP